MATLGAIGGVQIFGRGLRNYYTKKPICMSFEVTHSCTCNCVHCDKGGLKQETNLMKPSEYRPWVDKYKPCAIQISGGEPLTRPDLLDIIKNLRGNTILPIIVLVTNASLLTEEKYCAIKAAGVDRLSVSLDFADERHDGFRRYKGLYKHIEKLVPYLANKYKRNDIALNCAITHENMLDILNVAKRAKEWGVPVSYSAYSALRTGDKSLLIQNENDLKKLSELMEEVIKFKKENPGFVLNPIKTLRKTVTYFRNNSIPDCKAGQRYFVVRPDGFINACSMFPDKQYKDQKEAIEKFTKQNTCGECFVAIRAYTGKPFYEIMKDSISLN